MTAQCQSKIDGQQGPQSQGGMYRIMRKFPIEKRYRSAARGVGHGVILDLSSVHRLRDAHTPIIQGIERLS
jgi:hypothetical protein